VEIVEQLNALGIKHGIGRVDIVENRLVGMKSRGVYETPGGTILYKAHAALEQLCLDRDTLHYKQQVGLRYAELVYNGQWFTTLREALDAFVQTTEQNLTGQVRFKLYKGNLILAGRQSPYSLYRADIVTFEAEQVYDQSDANGFIRLFGLPLKVAGSLKLKTKGLEE
jgi:argininosuccinate synthase